MAPAEMLPANMLMESMSMVVCAFSAAAEEALAEKRLKELLHRSRKVTAWNSPETYVRWFKSSAARQLCYDA